MSVALGSGFWGIENKIEPTKSIMKLVENKVLSRFHRALATRQPVLENQKLQIALRERVHRTFLHDPRRIAQKPGGWWQLQHFEII